jgi:hypothetical protein
LQPDDEVALYVTNKSASGNVTFLRGRLVASTVGKQGVNGTSGTSGTSGAQGNKGGLLYTFSDSTSGATTSGFFRFNNATISSVTEVVINATTADGAIVTSYLSGIGNAAATPRGHIIIESNTNGDATYAIFSFTTVSTSFEVAYTATYISGTLPSNNEVCVISFNRTGSNGSSGTSAPYPSTNLFNYYNFI